MPQVSGLQGGQYLGPLEGQYQGPCGGRGGACLWGPGMTVLGPPAGTSLRVPGWPPVSGVLDPQSLSFPSEGKVNISIPKQLSVKCS